MPEINNPLQVISAIQKGQQNRMRDWWRTNYMLCKTFGWDYYTLMSQPIGFVNKMIECMNWETKENEKRDKRASQKMKGRSRRR